MSCLKKISWTVIFWLYFLMPIGISEVFSQTLPDSASEPTCDQKLNNELENYLTKHQEILALQFELTSLKLAQLILKNNKQTLESFIKELELKKNSHTDNVSLQSLVDLYETESANTIIEINNNPVRSATSKNGLNYFQKKNRLTNLEISNFMLNDILQNSTQSSFNMDDVAIAWLAQKISEKAQSENLKLKNHDSLNLLNLSTQVARYTGVIDNVKKTSLNELTQKIAKISNEIKKQFDQAKELAKQKITGCNFTAEENLSCHAESDLTKFIFDNKKIQQVIDQKMAHLIVSKARQDQLEKISTLPIKQITHLSESPASKKKDNTCSSNGDEFAYQAVVDNKKAYKFLKNFKTNLDKFKDVFLSIFSSQKMSKPTLEKPNGDIGLKFNFGEFFNYYNRCCDRKNISIEKPGFFFDIEFYFKTEIPYGIPIVGQVGVEFASKMSAAFNTETAEYPPNMCSTISKCGKVNLSVSPSAKIFARALDEFILIKGGLVASIRLSAKQCFVPTPYPPMHWTFIPAKILFEYSVESKLGVKLNSYFDLTQSILGSPHTIEGDVQIL